MTVYDDIVPYTYRVGTSVVENVLFKFFHILCVPRLDKVCKFRVFYKFRHWHVIHSASSVLAVSSTSTQSFMEKLARHSFEFNAP